MYNRRRYREKLKCFSATRVVSSRKTKVTECDNNYAISTKQLSEGLSRTGATAKTFGVDLDNVVGHITAIGSVTMESGRIIGKEVAV